MLNTENTVNVQISDYRKHAPALKCCIRKTNRFLVDKILTSFSITIQLNTWCTNDFFHELFLLWSKLLHQLFLTLLCFLPSTSSNYYVFQLLVTCICTAAYR